MRASFRQFGDTALFRIGRVILRAKVFWFFFHLIFLLKIKPSFFHLVLEEYFTYISALDFDTDPEYKYLRRLFCTAIREEGFLDDSILSFDNHAKLSKNTAYKVSLFDVFHLSDV